MTSRYSEFHTYQSIEAHPAVRELAQHAKRLGLMFKIEGYPFGAQYGDHLKTLSTCEAVPVGFDGKEYIFAYWPVQVENTESPST